MAAANLRTKKGQKVNANTLPKETAQPGVAGPRSWKRQSVAKAMTPTKLAGIFQRADEGDLADLLTLAGEIERRDSHIGAQIRTRKQACAGLPTIVEARSDSELDKKIASEVQAITQTHEFSHCVFSLLDGIFRPFAVCEILWEMGEIWRPVDYIFRDPNSFAVDLTTGNNLLLRDDDNPKGKPLEPWKFVVHTPRQFAGPLTTNGLVRPAAVMYALKLQGIASWMGYMELFGVPWRIGRFPKDATEKDRETLAEMVQAIGMEGGIVMPEGMDIQIVDGTMNTGSGTSLHMELCDWCDRQISKAILGQTLTADTGGGSYAQGVVHDGIRRTLLVADAKDLAATIMRDIVEPYVLINYGPDVPVPKFRFITEEPEDRAAWASMIGPLIDRGLPIQASVVMDVLGLEEPDAKKDTGKPVVLLHPIGKAEAPTGDPQK